MKKSPLLTALAVVAASALFFVLGGFVSLQSPVPDTTICLQYGLLAFVAALFGPVAGALTGLIGHTLIDWQAGSGIYWSWVIASGCFGVISGLAAKKLRLAEGVFSQNDMLTFNFYQMLGHAAAWGLIAPLLDILLGETRVRFAFTQGLAAALANIVTTAVLGTLLCMAFAAARPRKKAAAHPRQTPDAKP